jgi:hypothetical protein
MRRGCDMQTSGKIAAIAEAKVTVARLKRFVKTSPKGDILGIFTFLLVLPG